MDRVLVASAVAESLFSTEAAVEEALAQAVVLMRQMIDAKRALGVPAGAGDPALKRVTAAVEALGDAQREIIRTHGALEALGRNLGLAPTGFGPLIKPLGRQTDAQPAE